MQNTPDSVFYSPLYVRVSEYLFYAGKRNVFTAIAMAVIAKIEEFPYVKMEQDKYQGVHHELVASAMVKKYAASLGGDIKIGMMLYTDFAYPETTSPEDNFATWQKNQYEIYFADVLLRGEYPGYIKHPDAARPSE
ncbi:family 1 glycosylhydrolase [Klebsiella pneumoniae]